jgi:hypothetical protein
MNPSRGIMLDRDSTTISMNNNHFHEFRVVQVDELSSPKKTKKPARGWCLDKENRRDFPSFAKRGHDGVEAVPQLATTTTRSSCLLPAARSVLLGHLSPPVSSLLSAVCPAIKIFPPSLSHPFNQLNNYSFVVQLIVERDKIYIDKFIFLSTELELILVSSKYLRFCSEGFN